MSKENIKQRVTADIGELKLCPFCGGEGHLRIKNRTIVNGETRRNTYVYCLSCGARGERYFEGTTTEERKKAWKNAVCSWNRRFE